MTQDMSRHLRTWLRKACPTSIDMEAERERWPSCQWCEEPSYRPNMIPVAGTERLIRVCRNCTNMLVQDVKQKRIDKDMLQSVFRQLL